MHTIENWDKIDALYNKGRDLAGKKLFIESIDVFQRVVKELPHDALPQFYIGACYQRADNQYMAMHHYMQAIRLDADFAEAYNNIGKLYADFDGDIKTAILYLEKAVSATDNAKLLQVLYKNLCFLNKQIADFDRADHYKSKFDELQSEDINDNREE